MGFNYWLNKIVCSKQNDKLSSRGTFDYEYSMMNISNFAATDMITE